MNEKEIQSFSLETLLTANEPRPKTPYFDGCLIASRVKIMDTVNIDLFRYPTRLDAFAILFLFRRFDFVHLGTAPPHARREDAVRPPARLDSASGIHPAGVLGLPR